MAWGDYGNGAGAFRSGAASGSTVQLSAIPSILEELRAGLNERLQITSIDTLDCVQNGDMEEEAHWLPWKQSGVNPTLVYADYYQHGGALCLQVTVTSASAYGGVYQNFTDLSGNYEDFRGRTLNLSFWHRTGAGSLDLTCTITGKHAGVDNDLYVSSTITSTTTYAQFSASDIAIDWGSLGYYTELSLRIRTHDASVDGVFYLDDLLLTKQIHTYDQVQYDVALFKTKVTAILADVDHSFFTGGSWPATQVSGSSGLTTLLTAGSYGSSYLDFERLQDGRVYEQLRELLDNITAVSKIVSMNCIETYYGTHTDSTPGAAWSGAISNTWVTPGALMLSITPDVGSYDAYRSYGAPGVNILETVAKIVPDAYAFYWCVAGIPPRPSEDMTLKMGNQVFYWNDCLTPFAVYPDTVPASSPNVASIHLSIEAATIPDPLTPIPGTISWGIGVGASPSGVRAFDRGSTWVYKP